MNTIFYEFKCCPFNILGPNHPLFTIVKFVVTCTEKLANTVTSRIKVSCFMDSLFSIYVNLIITVRIAFKIVSCSQVK